MGCCGKARANFSRAAVAPAHTSATAVQSAGNQPWPQRPGTTSQPLMLRYVGRSAIVVRGPSTGRQYAFSVVEPAQPVDARDAAVFLRTHYFRREPPTSGRGAK